jgi:hypothetical protein
MGVGAGLLQTASSFEGNVGSMSAGDAIGEFTYSGGGLALDLVIGGSPSPGFVVAYGFAGQIAHEPNVAMEGSLGGDAEKTSSKSLGLAVHGIALDVFPDPKGGLELGGLLGVANVGTGPEDTSSFGWAAALWGGYGFWVQEQISLVALLRLAYARTSDDSYVPVASGSPTGGTTIDRLDETLTASLVAAFLLH